MQGISDLENGLKGEAPQKFPYPIAGNCLPHIDVFLENGYTKEEIKMIEETKKILQKLYENDFVLVSIHDLFYLDENQMMKKSELTISSIRISTRKALQSGLK